jgi:hypothetical protein
VIVERLLGEAAEGLEPAGGPRQDRSP